MGNSNDVNIVATAGRSLGVDHQVWCRGSPTFIEELIIILCDASDLWCGEQLECCISKSRLRSATCANLRTSLFANAIHESSSSFRRGRWRRLPCGLKHP